MTGYMVFCLRRKTSATYAGYYDRIFIPGRRYNFIRSLNIVLRKISDCLCRTFYDSGKSITINILCMKETHVSMVVNDRLGVICTLSYTNNVKARSHDANSLGRCKIGQYKFP